MKIKKYFDSVNVVEGVVFVREVTEEIDGDNVVSRNFFRRGIAPGEDVSDLPVELQEVCSNAWTEEVVQNFKSQILKGR
ncbi:MAG: hypothetical protein EBR82_43210 [Caulobacteraceae bacterium]|nr:hypothetical protein [Caulobacteraceae bacterium]